MPKINILDKRVAELIAAGEVVERPASVVKELMENSIDAGASAITVEIKSGGVSYIRVTDNGCGIAREDVDAAFVSHATSKISTQDDLDAIMTLGFRGEALASVAAVARVELLTRTEDEEIGTRYVIEGGEHILTDDAGCPKGTTIVIRDVFFNTPARMKFLKKDVTEANAVAGVVDRTALSHPEVSVRFIREGKETLFAPGDGKLESAVRSVFGKEFFETLIPAASEVDGICVSGYISKPSGARANRGMQFFFLNGRLIKTGTGSAALAEGYKSSVMVGKFPACVLNIQLEPHTVDVNVHPAKIEVRFSNEKSVFNAVYYCVKNALSGDTSHIKMQLRPDKKAVGNYLDLLAESEKATGSGGGRSFGKTGNASALPKKNPDFWSTGSASDIGLFGSDKDGDAVGKKAETSGGGDKAFESIGFDAPAIKTGARFLRDPSMMDIPYDEPTESVKPVSESKVEQVADVEAIKPAAQDRQPDSVSTENPRTQEKHEMTGGGDDNCAEPEKQPEMLIREQPRVVGEAFKTYIFAQLGESVFIIDKHAAHERMIYNELKSRGRDAARQMLLLPVTVTLPKEEYSAVLENLDTLLGCGLAVEDFGSGCVIVSECPLEIERDDIEDMIVELAGYFSQNRNEPVDARTDWIYHSAACRAAIKAGDFTSEYEREKFVERLFDSPEIRCCPHGRPVMIEMTRREMEKSFGRV